MGSSIRKTAVLSLLAVCFALLPTTSALACHVEDSAFTTSFRNDANLDLNDYSRILADADADDRHCAELAATALTTKLNNTRTSVWNEWLQGSLVAVIFSAANRIGANGFATQDLDNAL